MDVFIRGGFHAITRKRSGQEELEFKSLGYLPTDLYAIVLEYSYISDACLNDGNYLGREFRINGMIIQDVEIAKSYDLEMLSCDLACLGKRDAAQSVLLGINNIIPESLNKYKCSMIFIFELIISQNWKQTFYDHIRQLSMTTDVQINDTNVMFFTVSAVTCFEIITFG